VEDQGCEIVDDGRMGKQALLKNAIMSDQIVESYLGAPPMPPSIVSTSPIFSNISRKMEATSFPRYRALRAPRGGRLAYWNMQASRRYPVDLAGLVRRLDNLSGCLYRATSTFFYSAFYVDELR